MPHQPHASLAPRKVLLSLPQPSLASSLFSNPSAVTGSSTDSPDVASDCQYFIVYQAVETSQGNSDVPTTFWNPWRDGYVRQINRTEIKNPVRCEVCKIDFNSKSVFEEHVSGKKHRKKMQLHNSPSNTILSGTSNVKNVQVQDSSVQGQEPFVDAGQDLNFKKRKLLSGGEAEHDDQVSCGFQSVFFRGKKHRKKMQLHNNPSNTILSGTSNVKNVQVQDSSVQGQEPFVDAGQDLNFKKRKLLSGGEAEHDDQVDLTSNNDGIGSKKVKITQCTRCEICMINCNSKDIYITHLSGKKHLGNLKKLSKLESDGACAGADVSVACISAAIVTENDKQPALNPAAIGTQENPVIVEAQEKDSETKKQSESKGDGAGTDVSIPGMTAAIVAENDKQPAKNPAIESQEKLGTNKQECVNSCQPENAVILEAPEKDTESKKRRRELDGGTSIASTKSGTLSNANNETVFNLPDCPAQCEICMINCNSMPVYIRHISGKRHKRNMEKVSKSKNDGAGASVADAVSAIMPAIDAQQATNQAIEPQEKLETSSREGVDALKSGTLSNGNNETVFNLPDCPGQCEICMINCNSMPVYIRHISGKRHKRNMEKVSKSKNDGAGASVADAVSAIMPAIDAQQATNQAIEPQEKLETSSREGVDALKSGSVVTLEASEKDMETKRRKIEPFDGAAITTFRVCKLCKTRCNSVAAFNSHLHGKKHAAMVKKLADSKK
ncbi:hypothetical protein K1719_033698 [Acacia pycnantha]|nr:hypothetical protein K1719_033698 [Acacia pycnantha]